MSTHGKLSRMREIFAILTQGIELNEYAINPKTGRTEITPKVMWIETEIYRLCCDVARPSIAQKSQGFVPRGLYLRDISEIRDGTDAHPFSGDKKPADGECCLSMIGTEGTLSLELPSQYTRDWFIARFRLITEDILTSDERRYRRFKIWEKIKALGDEDTRAARNIESLLIQGIKMEHHDKSGMVEPVLLQYSKQTNSIFIKKKSKKYFGFITKDVELKIKLSDISEIRPGSHAMSFVLSSSGSEIKLDDRNASIVGSENCFDVTLVSSTARDMFIEQFYLFACKHNLHANRETQSDDSLQSSETAYTDTMTRNTAAESYSNSV
jgi:hypothetical protein